MADPREVIIRTLSRSIKTGEHFALSKYIPDPPTTPREALADATIRDTLNALQNNQTPAFSGDSSDYLHEEDTE